MSYDSKVLSFQGSMFPMSCVLRPLCFQGAMFPTFCLSMFPGLYVSKGLFSQCPMFPGLYFPNVRSFQGSMFPISYVPIVTCSQGSIFPMSNLSKALYSQCPMFPGLFVPKTLCSYGTISQGSTAMYSQGSMLAGPYVPTALYSHHPMYPRSYIIKVICSNSFLFQRRSSLWALCSQVPIFPTSLIPQSYFPRTLCSHSPKSHSFYGAMFLGFSRVTDTCVILCVWLHTTLHTLGQPFQECVWCRMWNRVTDQVGTYPDVCVRTLDCEANAWEVSRSVSYTPLPSGYTHMPKIRLLSMFLVNIASTHSQYLREPNQPLEGTPSRSISSSLSWCISIFANGSNKTHTVPNLAHFFLAATIVWSYGLQDSRWVRESNRKPRGLPEWSRCHWFHLVLGKVLHDAQKKKKKTPAVQTEYKPVIIFK